MEHFDQANIGRWTAAGYDAELTTDFLSTVLATLNHPNTVLEVSDHAAELTPRGTAAGFNPPSCCRCASISYVPAANLYYAHLLCQVLCCLPMPESLVS
jgi:hypothetical protein